MIGRFVKCDFYRTDSVVKWVVTVGAFACVSACVSTPPSVSAQKPAQASFSPLKKASQAKPMSDSILGKWTIYPAIGTSTRGCSITFHKSAFSETKGRVDVFACNLVKGLGGINGVNRINAWSRKGRTIILSGIATPNIGTIDLRANSFTDRVAGATKDDIRFVMIRQ